MKPKISDAILIAGIALGGVLVWHTGEERGRLEAKAARLVRVTGDMPITDPAKVHILALDTGEPLHFAWRVYLPPKYNQVLSARSWGGSSTHYPSGGEFIARTRFRETDGTLSVYTSFSNGSSTNGGDPKLARLLHGRWDKIRVEQIGKEHLETVDAKGSAVLLRLTLPPEIWDEAKEEHPYEKPVFYELKLGPKS